MQNALTIDLEEWYHPETIHRSGVIVQRFSQVVEATIPILDLLKRYQVNATFFTVGEILEAHPHLIERLLNEGHELAFHGWTHKPLWVLNPDLLAAEIEKFFHVLGQNFPGVKVRGFRAPTFSLDEKTAWAVSVLMQYGFEYDTSVFPARTSLYGLPGAPLRPYHLSQEHPAKCDEKGLLEIPMTVFPLIDGIKMGFTGGLYLRALPFFLCKYLIRRTNVAEQVAVIYIHPWETYAQTPRLKLPPIARFIVYAGIPGFPKLENLLQNFEFDTVENIFLPKNR